MRRRAKTDGNQAEIVGLLRANGFSVYPAHAMGNGFPDLVAGWGKQTFLIEVKDGKTPPSQQALTEAQVAFLEEWRGHAEVLNSAEAVRQWVAEVKGRRG